MKFNFLVPAVLMFFLFAGSVSGADKLIDEIEKHINDIGQDCVQARVKVKSLIDEYRESSGSVKGADSGSNIKGGEITLSQLRADSSSYKGKYLKVKGYVIDVYTSKINTDYYVIVLNDTWAAEDYRNQNINLVKLAVNKRKFGWAETQRLRLDEKLHTFAGTAEEFEWEDKRTGKKYSGVSIIVDVID